MLLDNIERHREITRAVPLRDGLEGKETENLEAEKSVRRLLKNEVLL